MFFYIRSHIEELEDRLKRMENLIQNISKEKSDDTHREIAENTMMPDRQSSSSSLCSRTSYEEEEEEIEEGEMEEEEKEEEPVVPAFECQILLNRLGGDKEFNDMQMKMNELTLSDYQRTRYFGASAGVQFLKDEFLQTNVRHHLPDNPSWFIQKLNEDDDEHIIMKSQNIDPLPQVPDELRTDRIKLFENTPYMTQKLADYLIHM